MWGLTADELVAIAAAQLAFSLYGPGLRRPFGDLSTIEYLPDGLRFAGWPIKVADWFSILFLAAIWATLLFKAAPFPLAMAGIGFSVIGGSLCHYIDVYTSLFWCVILACVAILALFW